MSIRKRESRKGGSLFGFLRVFFVENPLYLNTGREEGFNRLLELEMIWQYSRVVLDLPEEMQRILILPGDRPTTLQESFVVHFFRAKPPAMEFDVFRHRFTEIYTSISSKYLPGPLTESKIREF